MLSERGIEQAQRLADRLSDRQAAPPLPIPDVPPQAIWHSPLQRAAATARAIAERTGGADLLQPMDELIEVSVGDWEGLSDHEVARRWPAELTAWRTDVTMGLIPGGEPAAEASVRVRAGLESIIEVLDARATEAAAWGVIVAHDGIVRLCLLELLDLPLGRYWSFPVPVAGASILDRAPGGPWRLRLHGLIA